MYTLDKDIIATANRISNAIWTEMIFDKDGNGTLLEKDIPMVIEKLIGGTNADKYKRSELKKLFYSLFTHDLPPEWFGGKVDTAAVDLFFEHIIKKEH